MAPTECEFSRNMQCTDIQGWQRVRGQDGPHMHVQCRTYRHESRHRIDLKQQLIMAYEARSLEALESLGAGLAKAQPVRRCKTDFLGTIKACTIVPGPQALEQASCWSRLCEQSQSGCVRSMGAIDIQQRPKGSKP